jgi:glycosyltransferase involved in cell wall biosynthesis
MQPLTIPTVSIITPSYNQAHFIEETIRSVLAQDYAGIEYIIVDGGSTDGSVEIIKKYADQLTWWISEKDQGHADALNKGFAHASGEFLAWLNSDDTYYPGAVSEAVAFLRAYPDVGMVYGDADLTDCADQCTYPRRRLFSGRSYGGRSGRWISAFFMLLIIIYGCSWPRSPSCIICLAYGQLSDYTARESPSVSTTAVIRIC